MRADPLVLLDGGRGARLERTVSRRAPDRALLAVDHLDVRHQTEIGFVVSPTPKDGTGSDLIDLRLTWREI